MATHSDFCSSTVGSTVAQAFADNVRGKVILITGCNIQGIGGSTATSLATQNPNLLILAGRSEAKVSEVAAAVNKTNPSVRTRFLQLDLSSTAAVRKAAAEVEGYQEHIDIVINNAAVMALTDRELSPDGIEMQFATNHIGHFLFVNLITQKLFESAKKNPAGSTRVVNVSSFGHMFSPVRYSDINFAKASSQIPEAERPDLVLAKSLRLPVRQSSNPNAAGYIPFAAYGQSKSANVLLSLSLNQKLGKHGIKSFALHPGSIETELPRYMSEEALEDIAEARKNPKFTQKTLAQGSSTTLVAALDPALSAAGKDFYLSDCQLIDAAPWAVDADNAEKLWKLSESLVGQKFEYK